MLCSVLKYVDVCAFLYGSNGDPFFHFSLIPSMPFLSTQIPYRKFVVFFIFFSRRFNVPWIRTVRCLAGTVITKSNELDRWIYSWFLISSLSLFLCQRFLFLCNYNHMHNNESCVFIILFMRFRWTFSHTIGAKYCLCIASE